MGNVTGRIKHLAATMRQHLFHRVARGWRCLPSSQRIRRQRRAPACLFPIRNEKTGNIVWFEVMPSGYGLYVTVHQSCPSLQEPLGISPETSMTTIHVDYFVSFPQEKEQIMVQLWDERAGPYGDPGWRIPDDSDRYADASIVLVSDVQAWQPPAESAEPPTFSHEKSV